MTRYEELQAKGYINLTAEERKEYKSYKEAITEDMREAQKEDDFEEETPVETPSQIQEVQNAPYFWTRNIKFKGVIYAKGQKVPDMYRNEIVELLNLNYITL